MPPHESCGARTRAGGTCGRLPMRGQARCDLHGGKSPQALRAAARRIERQRVMAALGTLGIPVEEGADALEVLARVLSISAGDLETLRVAVGSVDDLDPRQPVVRLYLDALDRAGRLAKVAADSNLAERQAAISEANIRTVVDAVRRAVDSLPLEMADRQRVLNAISRELRSVHA